MRVHARLRKAACLKWKQGNVAFKNSAARYGLFSKILHWVNALLIISLVGLGCYMVGLTYYDRWYNATLAWHKSLGLTALGLALLMIGWQWYNPPPGPLATMQHWERWAAGVMRGALANSLSEAIGAPLA